MHAHPLLYASGTMLKHNDILENLKLSVLCPNYDETLDLPDTAH